MRAEGQTMPLSLSVNGRPVSREVEPRRHLADFLREDLNLTGTHLGCEHGVCGACTVLVDGEPIRPCITLAGACGGAEVTTIEGLDDDEIAIELRAAFNREHALQCDSARRECLSPLVTWSCACGSPTSGASGWVLAATCAVAPATLASSRLSEA